MSWDTSGFDAAVARARDAVRESAAAHVLLQSNILLLDAEGASDFPYDTGSLENSGKVSEPVWDGDRVACVVSFGGASPGFPHDPVTYAEDVHDGEGRRNPRPYLAAPFHDEAEGRVELAAADTFEDIQRAWGNA